MQFVYHVDTVSEYNAGANHPTLHPLVSVIDFSRSNPIKRSEQVRAVSFGFYSVFLKNDQNCRIRYGRRNYDYQAGTLLFIAPDQVISIEDDPEDYQPSGYALLIHPDSISRTIVSFPTK